MDSIKLLRNFGPSIMTSSAKKYYNKCRSVTLIATPVDEDMCRYSYREYMLRNDGAWYYYSTSEIQELQKMRQLRCKEVFVDFKEHPNSSIISFSKFARHILPGIGPLGHDAEFSSDVGRQHEKLFSKVRGLCEEYVITFRSLSLVYCASNLQFQRELFYFVLSQGRSGHLEIIFFRGGWPTALTSLCEDLARLPSITTICATACEAHFDVDFLKRMTTIMLRGRKNEFLLEGRFLGRREELSQNFSTVRDYKWRSDTSQHGKFIEITYDDINISMRLGDEAEELRQLLSR
ncbi:hypothetical protein QR680_018514 [Steinernema hermaphroditum]|uniref:Uncharacterized protein n=1 Tax=Steinernema hermaphroditum TaxID=289476 RepID=A0AA39HJ13_9BILA|nr:hypothetical protein QR680_018514 [Steinernema hermaphroditum]